MIPAFDERGNLPAGIHKAGWGEASAKGTPGDFDVCWKASGVNADLLDPVFLDFSSGRLAQKARNSPAGARGVALIGNERQYRISRATLRRFDKSIAAHEQSEPSKGVDPRIHAAIGAAMKSEAEELGRQIQRYEDLRDGRVESRELDGLRAVPAALIEGRIVAGLTQKELAERLGLKQQQIQHWEANAYSGVGLDRVQDIVDALGMGLRETVRYAVPG